MLLWAIHEVRTPYHLVLHAVLYVKMMLHLYFNKVLGRNHREVSTRLSDEDLLILMLLEKLLNQLASVSVDVVGEIIKTGILHTANESLSFGCE